MRHGPVAFVFPDGLITADGFTNSDFGVVCTDLANLGWRRRSTVQIKRAGTCEDIGSVRLADVIDAAPSDPVRNAAWWHERPNIVEQE